MGHYMNDVIDLCRKCDRENQRDGLCEKHWRMKHAPTYLQQGADAACVLYALCNARRWYGLESPEPGSGAWERLVDLAGCRHGSAVAGEAAAAELGLVLEPIGSLGEAVAPAVLCIYNPGLGSTMHAVLMTSKTADNVTLANYRYGGPPLVTISPPSGLGLARGQHWNVKLSKEADRVVR